MSQPEHTRFQYFLLQARHGAPNGTGAVRVTLEDLASGDRWDFGSPLELARFIETGREPPELEPSPDVGHQVTAN